MYVFKGKNSVKIAIFHFFSQEMARWCSWKEGKAVFSFGRFYHRFWLTATIYSWYKKHQSQSKNATCWKLSKIFHEITVWVLTNVSELWYYQYYEGEKTFWNFSALGGVTAWGFLHPKSEGGHYWSITSVTRCLMTWWAARWNAMLFTHQCKQQNREGIQTEWKCFNLHLSVMTNTERRTPTKEEHWFKHTKTVIFSEIPRNTITRFQHFPDLPNNSFL